jgi:peptidoglycan/LPS O-acetylase OafA/YrhL
VEGLRAVAAASVLVYHVWLYSVPTAQAPQFGVLNRLVFPHLALGVTLFFVLSGFLLYRPHVTAVLRRTERPALSRYVRNRALRILPAYWVILGCTTVVLPAAMLRLSPTELTLGRLIRDPELLLRNAALIQTYFPDSLLTGITPAWSLSVEVAFYVALPALGWLAAAAANRAAGLRQRLAAVLMPVALLLVFGWVGKGIAATLITPGTGPNPGWDGDVQSVVIRSFWANADLFAFGMVLAVIRGAVEEQAMRLPRGWRTIGTAAFILTTAAVALLSDAGLTAPGRVVYDDLAALACALLLALVVLPNKAGTCDSHLVRLLERRPIAAIGVVSYSVFLWHEPLVRYLHSLGITQPGNSGFFINLALVAAITGVLAWTTYTLVERPALRRKPVAHATEAVEVSPAAG